MTHGGPPGHHGGNAVLPRRAPDPSFPRRPATVAALAMAPLLTCLVLSRPWLGMLAVAGAMLILLALYAPVMASVCLVPAALLGASQSGGEAMAFGGIAVVAGAVALRAVAAATPVAPRWLPEVRLARGSHGWIVLLALLLIVSFCFPSVTLGTPPSRFVDLAGVLAGLALVAAAIADPPSPGTLARVIALGGAAAGAYALAGGDQVAGRLQGFGLNPNYLGAMLVLPLVAAAGLTRRTRRPLWLVPAAVCLAGIIATESRGGLLATAAGVAVVLVDGRPRKVQALIVAAVAVACTVLPGGTDTAEHVAAGGRPAVELSSNTEVREQAARFAAEVAAGHPLQGIGYGMFPPYAERSERLGLYIATHNDYLRLAAEAGILTLAVFLVLLWRGMRGRRHGDLAVLRAVVVAYAAGLFFANQLANLVISMPFWLSLGCLLAAPPGRTRFASSQGEQHT